MGAVHGRVVAYALTMSVLTVAICSAHAFAQPAELASILEGLVRPSREVDLAAPLEGRLAVMAVRQSQAVEKGELLLRMDNALQRLRVEAAQLRAASEVAIEAAKLALEDAQISLDQVERTFKAGAASDWEVRRARIQRDQRQAELKEARENHKLAQVELALEQERLAQHEVTAPFAGSVLALHTEAGASLTEQDKVITLVQLDPLEAHIYLPLTVSEQLEVGASVTLYADEPINRKLSAKVDRQEAVIDTASSTRRVVFRIDNPEGEMPAGFKVWLIDQAATASTGE